VNRRVPRSANHPLLDPEYSELIRSGQLALLRTINPDEIPAFRGERESQPIEALIGARRIHHETVTVRTSGLPVTILTPDDGRQVKGWVLAIHGGGLVVGDRLTGIEFTFDWVEKLSLGVVTPEYRLAPEHPYPAALEDCDRALAWALDYIAERNESALPLILSGVSAGGALAVALTLTLKDRGDPAFAGLLLQAPMLDHRNDTISARQFAGFGQWDQESNAAGWSAYLGPAFPHETAPYASPALATDLSGMPPTFIDVGSAETFRDEDVTFASSLWAAGVQAQLAVWPGGVHGFDRVAPDTKLARIAVAVRNEWLTRIVQDHTG